MTSDIILALQAIGIATPKEIIHNPSYTTLFDEETQDTLTGYEQVQLTNLRAVNVNTGKYTGRSPKDKYIVCDEQTKDTLWWRDENNNNDNKPINSEVWQQLEALACEQLSHKKLYVVDAYCGANRNTGLKVRFVTEVAWQAHFVTNMFIRPSKAELAEFIPDFHVINASKASCQEHKALGLNSPTVIAFNLTQKMQLILGTWYGGEMKKGLFSIMNYLLPLKDISSMHCSANVGKDADVALFFGLSGTGKTTLSSDSKRQLIGDDEHGWDDEGVFNYEGGCYAKTIDLDATKEPEIYAAIKRNALLENVTVNDDQSINFEDRCRTENTRVSYPIEHIENRVQPISKAGHATKIIFLTADAFGVFPAVSALSSEQTRYYFLSGFTAKMAGTERGIKKPTPVFSACFGEAFLLLHPTQYADILNAKIQQHNSKVYLVNTGWNGQGERISLPNTRAIIDSILDGTMDKAMLNNSENDSSFDQLPVFNLKFPTQLPNIDSSVLDPRLSYSSTDDWQQKANELANLFVNNFQTFTDTDSGKFLAKVAAPIPV